MYLPTLLTELSALLTQGLAACAFAPVLRLDVVAGVALCVIVVDILFDGMPRALFHDGCSIVKCRV
jgi:hypothetical protein